MASSLQRLEWREYEWRLSAYSCTSYYCGPISSSIPGMQRCSVLTKDFTPCLSLLDEGADPENRVAQLPLGEGAIHHPLPLRASGCLSDNQSSQSSRDSLLLFIFRCNLVPFHNHRATSGSRCVVEQLAALGR